MDLTTDTMQTRTLTKLRREYAKIRTRSHCHDAVEFDAAVKAYMAEHAMAETPELFLRAARLVTFPCRRCAGTGAFITYVENGQPKGPGGVCFRCAGKGRQNDRDARRNYGADMHQRVF